MAEQTPQQLEKNYTDMDYTQSQRQRIADKIINKAIDNEDPEMLNVAMKALDGMDKNSLGRLKINQKQQENNNSAASTEALAGVVLALSDRRTNRGRPAVSSSAVPGTKLPEGRRPAYDKSIRDTTPGTENTTEFTTRVEAKA